MIEGKTTSGFEFKIDENIADDWEFLKMIRKTNDEPAYIIDVAGKVLGDKQLKKLEKHCRDKSGKVTITAITTEMTEIFESAGEIKNS